MLRQRSGTTAFEVCGALTFRFQRRPDAVRRTRRRLRPNGRWLKHQLADRASAKSLRVILSFHPIPRRTPSLIAIEISKQKRADAIASLKRYFEENMEPIGDLPASLLLNYFLEE